MGTGWRRAFGTTVSRDPSHHSSSSSDQKHQLNPTPTPRTGGGSNSVDATALVAETPKKCKSTTRTTSFLGSNPSSPGSPLKLSLFKNSFKFRSSCGICFNSVKAGQGTAIYTAECGHAFHFSCIADHVRKHSSLFCPVCNFNWTNVPFLAVPPLGKLKTESSPRLGNLTPTQHPKLPHFRSYDDDDPLLSPTAGGMFNSVPETEDNVDQEDDGVEGRDLRNVEVKILPESALVSVSRSHETYAVVLRVKAPPPPPSFARNTSLLQPSHRAPIDLVTVLDVSGSMTGAKLHMLKRAMRLVVSSLGSADRLSIVAFSATPKRLLPLTRMTVSGQRVARRIVDLLAIGQGTSVGDALRKAAKVLADRRERNPVASIMLLSDGHDDQVQSTSNPRHGSSHVSSTRFTHMEIPVEPYQDPSEDAFAKCVGGLLSVVVQDLRLQLGFATGYAPAEITAVYSCSGRPTVLNSNSVRIGDLYAGEDRELLVEMRVPSGAVGAHHVMSVKSSYKDPATQEVYYGRDQALLVPSPHAVRSSGPKIERLRNLFITTRAIAESRRLIDHASAHQLLASAIQSSRTGGDEYVRGVEAELQWRRQQQAVTDENGEQQTPSSEKITEVGMMNKSLDRVSDLHGFENARF